MGSFQRCRRGDITYSDGHCDELGRVVVGRVCGEEVEVPQERPRSLALAHYVSNRYKRIEILGCIRNGIMVQCSLMRAITMFNNKSCSDPLRRVLDLRLQLIGRNRHDVHIHAEEQQQILKKKQPRSSVHSSIAYTLI